MRKRSLSSRSTVRGPTWLHEVYWWVVASLTVVAVSYGAVFGWRIFRVWDQRNWFGHEPYRLLVLHGKMATEPAAIDLVTIWPDTAKAAVLSIPPELRIPAVGGYGTYRIAALVELGRVEQVGDRILRDSVSFTFGVPIHQVLWQTGAAVDFNRARINLLQNGFMGKQSIQEVSEILTLMGNVNPRIWEQIDLSKRNAVRPTTEADGSQLLDIEPALLDNLMMEKMSTIWKEAALTQVALVNASSKPQLAAAWSKLPRIGGYDVVSVTDQQETVEQTQIIFAEEGQKNSLPGIVLQHMFPHAQVTVADTSKYRAQVAVVLGSDSWRWLNDREAYLKGN